MAQGLDLTRFSFGRSPEFGATTYFSPTQIAAIKALACELPYKLDLPFSQVSLLELQDYLIKQEVVEHISIGKLWTVLVDGAIRPWYHRSWLFPRDPQFLAKAGPILDLYQDTFQDRELRAREYVLSFDQKTSIQARRRKHATVPSQSGHPQLVEHEYEQQGALNLLACLDVHSGHVWGRCYPRKRRAEVEAFVNELFAGEPYASAKRIHSYERAHSGHFGKSTHAAGETQRQWQVSAAPCRMIS